MGIWSVSLWIVQILLAFAFGAAGTMKTFTPIDELALQMPWVVSAPALARFIGVSEIAGAIGLILPAATRIKPSLTPLAAWALVLVMILAALFHAVRGEWSAIPINVVIGALAAFVAWGRSRKAPITVR